MEKRTPEQMEKDKARVLSAITKIGPATAEQICKATKFPIQRFRLPVRKLLADKKIKRHGQGVKRAKQYVAR